MMFSDLSTRAYSLPNVASSDLLWVKSKVVQLNKVFDGEPGGISAAVVTYAENMKNTFVSSNGAALSRISKASFTVTEEEVIYNVNS